MRRLSLWIAPTLLLAWCAAGSLAAPTAPAPVALKPDGRGIEFFEKRVRPLLAEQCFGCHTGAKAAGKLEMRSRAGLLKGGALGPAVVPGDPDKSLLVQVLRYDGHLKMPPKGKLPAPQLQVVTDWVKMGAPWPDPAAPVLGANGKPARPIDPTARWAFQPVREPIVPPVRNSAWVKTPVDRFILARLEGQKLKPNGYADRRTLIRRATFDLTGLPPTPEEVEAFETDRDPNAWEKVIDRLLASPRYGERWGRHWLDVVRYSDSNGLDENEIFANAWRYRDYVIQCFNEDRPYDRFLKEQIAGDLLPAASDAERYERLVATGFLVMGPKVLAERDKDKLRMDVIDEQLDSVGKAFLGMTVGCARCHDHKFDPISTKDYYALAGIFKSTTTLFGNLQNNVAVSGWLERPLAPQPMVEARKAHDAAVKKLQDALKKAKEQPEKDRLTAEIKALEAKAPPAVPMAMAVKDDKIENVRVHLRGSHLTLGDEVPRGFLSAVGPQPAIPKDHSGRLELAEWITSPNNPLTARVMANRIWHYHFGRGIVGSTDNFGKLGDRPTHPELLDWLARRFVEGGWSVKKMHRLLTLSSAYQVSGEQNPASYAKDPDNRLLWRRSRLRLEAEAIRDAVLWSNDSLDPTTGGTLVKGSGVAVTQDSKTAVEYQSSRRSVYLPVIRTTVYEMFQVFDFVDPHVVTGKREPTTVMAQALFMMNSPFALEQSGKFAQYLLAQDGDDAKRVETAYLRTLQRSPSASEIAKALEFIAEYAKALEANEKDAGKRRQEAWRGFSQALYASSEFRHLD